MHFGTLPCEYSPGRSYLDLTVSRNRVPSGMTRRWLFGFAPLAIGFAGGAASSLGFMNLFDSEVPVDDPTPVSTSVDLGTVEWALWIQNAPEAEFLEAAGELERVRLRAPGDSRLTNVFVRLLSAALRSEQIIADQAGVIAVRCLDRLGADHHLLILDDRVLERSDRPATARELKRVRRRDREGRMR